MTSGAQQIQPTESEHSEDTATRLDAIENQLDDITRLLDTIHVNVTALFTHLQATPPSISRPRT